MSVKVIIKIVSLFVICLSMQCLRKDRIEPTVYITNPQENSTVAGAIRIKAVAMDNKEVTYVEFFINNVRKGVDSTASNSVYEYVWNTSSEAAGTKTVTAKAYDRVGNVGESPSIMVTIEALGPTYHSGIISQNQTWTKRQSPHIVNQPVQVAAILTIEAGAVIRFRSNTGLSVSSEGDIIARGTDNEPILWTSNEQEPYSGDWQDIAIYYSERSNTIFDNCVIEYANNGIYLEERAVSVINTAIQECSDYGLVCVYGRFNQFSNNIITRNEYFPIAITTDAVYTLGENNNFTGNYGWGELIDAIEVFEDYKSSQLKTEQRKRQQKNIPQRHKDTQRDFTAEISEKSENGSSAASAFSAVISKSSKNGIQNSGRWRNHNVPYLVQGELYFEDIYTLTIDPGCVLGFDGDGIEVSDGATLQANEVTFTSRYQLEEGQGNPGDWSGIYVSDANLILQNCIVEYGGSDEAMIMLEDLQENQQCVLSNCVIRHSGNSGVLINVDEARIGHPFICFMPDEENINTQITNTRITNCQEMPITLNSANLIKCLGQGNNFAGNYLDFVEVENGGEIIRSCTWYNCGVPYVIEGTVTIYSEDSPTTLVISSGVTIGFSEGIEISDGPTLVANNVTFTSREKIEEGQGYPGDWQGIYVDNGSLNLQNCIIEYAGSWGDGAIYYQNSEEYRSISIDNCIIRYIEQSGISLDIQAISDVHITNTRITYCSEYPMVIYNAEYIRALGPGNNFSGNGNDVIWVPDGEEVITSGIWYNCAVPYLIESDIVIQEDWQNFPPTITIMPGVIMKFAGGFLIVEQGTLIADGSAGTIVFTVDEDYEHWGGIIFEDETNDNLTRLNRCIIQYGGNDYYGPANIICRNSAPRITNNEICYSRGWGMILRNSVLHPDTLRRYNRFYNNDSGDIRVDTIVSKSILKTKFVGQTLNSVQGSLAKPLSSPKGMRYATKSRLGRTPYRTGASKLVPDYKPAIRHKHTGHRANRQTR